MYVIIKLDCYGNESFMGGSPEEAYGPYDTYESAQKAKKTLPDEFACEYRIVNLYAPKG